MACACRHLRITQRAGHPRDVVAQLPHLQEQLDEIMRDTALMGSTVTGIVERMRARARE